MSEELVPSLTKPIKKLHVWTNKRLFWQGWPRQNSHQLCHLACGTGSGKEPQAWL